MAKLKLVATGRWLTLVCASLGMLVSLPGAANAQSVLTWARVELIRNQVQLVTGGRSRRAQVSDVLGVNDALSTARRARAELRFNDGSLARIGESAVFRFTPDTRNFRLSNGTVLLLIPPGQGRTTIQTPNAVTGIRGSALFVRFIPETNTTIIGALTTNPGGPMMAFNEDGTAQQSLNAGEMAVVRGDGTIEH
ncbi:MAG: FecR family protein, partial [Cyanobacteria bacterium J06642_11]